MEVFDPYQLVEKYKRDLLKEHLAMCSEQSNKLFNDIFPNGVPEKDLMPALDLVARTLNKNWNYGKQ